MTFVVLGRISSGEDHQREVMGDALAIVDLDPGLASGATYRRDDLRGNACPWVADSARRVVDDTIGLDDAEPAASVLESAGWAVRRWVVPGDDPTIFEITAARGQDQLRMSFADRSLGVYVTTRPCDVGPEDLAGFGGAVEIGVFSN